LMRAALAMVESISPVRSDEEPVPPQLHDAATQVRTARTSIASDLIVMFFSVHEAWRTCPDAPGRSVVHSTSLQIACRIVRRSTPGRVSWTKAVCGALSPKNGEDPPPGLQ